MDLLNSVVVKCYLRLLTALQYDGIAISIPLGWKKTRIGRKNI